MQNLTKNLSLSATTQTLSKRRIMIDHLEDFLWGFSIVSIALYIFQSFRKAISIPSFSLSKYFRLCSSSSSHSLPPPLSWVIQFFLDEQGFAPQPNSCQEETTILQGFQSCEMKRKGLGDGSLLFCGEEIVKQEEDIHNYETYQKGLHDTYLSQESSGFLLKKQSLDSTRLDNKVGDKGGINKLKKRPAMLVLPRYCPELDQFGGVDRKLENKQFEVQGRDFFLASKKGRREVMEDGYGVMVDILGDRKQAFFAVIDGHGGRAAADFVAENLGKNIVKAIENAGNKEEDELEQAIRGGYLITDRQFLSQGVSSGACAASALLKDGELHVANVGDCRVVLSRKGVADALTIDHRASREDERLRIEKSGGYLHCRNGIWRVHGSLAISRAIGDQHLKEWIISEPHIKRLKLTSDCEFLIMASDGLWDKVNEQEAVDIVLGERNSKESCKKLVDISFGRGNLDDITVMVVNLQNFVTYDR